MYRFLDLKGIPHRFPGFCDYFEVLASAREWWW
jgi:hypothetical protein